MTEIIIQILVEIIISPIGGFIRWIIYRQKSLKSYMNDDYQNNLGAVLILCGLVVVILVVVINL
tara:strand:+ start:595 stop:786 length:192 start_codon:yes stop_codon:yes gene_type:complete